MKLQTKLSWSLLGGVLLVTVLSQGIQQVRNATLAEALATKNLAHEQETQWEWVRNLDHSTQTALVDAMALGDMDRFRKLLDSMREITGLQDVTLFNNQDIAAYSSDAARLKSTLPPEIKAALAQRDQFEHQSDEAFGLFHVLRVQKDCLQCHDRFQEGAVGGVLAFRYSTAGLREARQQWNGFADQTRTAAWWNAGLSIVGLTVVLWGLMALTVRRQIARPLGRISAELTEGSERLRAASDSIATNSTQLAQSASHQAASLEETSASLEEMSSMTRCNAEHAGKADAVARRVATAVEAGLRDVGDLSQAMERVRGAGAEVATIAGTIDGIAFQTNLLALNAAVEAARAGEAGLGFAVVADEVRQLAQRSATAAKESASRIQEAVDRGAQGAQLTERVRVGLQGIQAELQQLNALASKVSAASNEQSQGIGQINQAVTDLDRVTQGTAASAEGSAHAAQEMRAYSEQLDVAIRGLLCLLDGTEGTTSVAPTAVESPVPGCRSTAPKGAARSRAVRPVLHEV